MTLLFPSGMGWIVDALMSEGVCVCVFACVCVCVCIYACVCVQHIVCVVVANLCPTRMSSFALLNTSDNISVRICKIFQSEERERER